MINNYQWYTPSNSIESADGFHQIMALGTLDEIHEVIAKIGQEKAKELFVKYPKKVYYPATYFLIKNYILKIDKDLHEQKYFKTTPRIIG